MGNGTKENPYTREDVLRLIEENRGTAKGLNLSGKSFEEQIDLSNLNLNEINLENTEFISHHDNNGIIGANFENSALTYANLRGIKLIGANIRGGHLTKANLEGADLAYTNINNACLLGVNLKAANLHDAHLKNTNLKDVHFERADLTFTDLENADLMYAYLEGADLSYANLKNAELANSKVSKTNLTGANLSGVGLYNVEFHHDTVLEEINWGNFILKEEIDGDTKEVEEREEVEVNVWFIDVAATYRRLKTWYTEHGVYNLAGEFFFREMTAKRKSMRWLPNPLPRIWSKLIALLCGYGEKPLRVIFSAGIIVAGLACLYFISNALTPDTFLNSLYYSAVSFTALGYGSWAPEPIGWAKGLGVFESFIGVFMMALFLLTFTRKMSR